MLSVELSADELREMDEASARIPVGEPRYPEALEKMVGRCSAGRPPGPRRIFKSVTLRCLIVLLLALAPGRAQAQVSAPSPQPGVAALAQARSALAAGHNQQAFTLLLGVAASQPTQKGVQHDLGLAAYRSGHLAEAQKAFAEAVAQDATDLESVQMEGLTFYRMHRYAQAIPYLERVRQAMPNAGADANRVLGLCYLNTQQLDAARGAFAAQYGLAPASGAAYLLLARVLIAANLPEQAAQAAQKALSLAPDLPLAHYVLGEVDLFDDKAQDALAQFEAEAKLNPVYAPVYDRLGDTCLRLGRYDQARLELTRSISLDTSSTGPFILMGKLLLRQNDPQTAVLYLKHAAAMDPGNFMTHTMLGHAYRALGDEPAASRELDAAARIHAQSDVAVQGTLHLEDTH